MLTEDDIRRALRACYDPGSPYGKPLNIVDLGCVQSISLALDPDAPGAGIAGVPAPQRLTLELSPASADADANEQLFAQIQNRLRGVAGLSGITIGVVETPAWSPARISTEGRRLLGLDALPFPILNNRLR